MENIVFDSHKRYTHYLVADGQGEVVAEGRVEHVRGEICRLLSQFTPGSPVAVETVGNWYWIVDEIEQAGMTPRLVHAHKAKLMMGCVNKTDRLDVRGLNRLQRAGTLPTVWIPPHDVRDKRDLTRTRMYLVRQRTCLKCRIHATLAKYALGVPEVSDLFGVGSRTVLRAHVVQLPLQTQLTTQLQLAHIGQLDQTIEQLNRRTKEVCEATEAVCFLDSLPGIGFVLGVVISLEVGEVGRFHGPDKLAAYAGTVPRVKASGGRLRYGALRTDVNHYLKWAFAEAANAISITREKRPQRHVSRLYEQVRCRKGHATAIGAVARHLAEATYWVLTRKEPYREPCLRRALPRDA